MRIVTFSTATPRFAQAASTSVNFAQTKDQHTPYWLIPLTPDEDESFLADKEDALIEDYGAAERKSPAAVYELLHQAIHAPIAYVRGVAIHLAMDSSAIPEPLLTKWIAQLKNDSDHMVRNDATDAEEQLAKRSPHRLKLKA